MKLDEFKRLVMRELLEHENGTEKRANELIKAVEEMRELITRVYKIT